MLTGQLAIPPERAPPLLLPSAGRGEGAQGSYAGFPRGQGEGLGMGSSQSSDAGTLSVAGCPCQPLQPSLWIPLPIISPCSPAGIWLEPVFLLSCSTTIPLSGAAENIRDGFVFA